MHVTSSSTDTDMPKPFKQIMPCNGAWLFVDTDGMLYVMGDNNSGRLGVTADSNITQPVSIGIQLEEDEVVIKFHSCKLLTAIYTSLKRLFIARVVKPSASMIRSLEGFDEGYDEGYGTYFYDELTVPAEDTDADYWPVQEPMAFTTSYARQEVHTTEDTVLEPVAPIDTDTELALDHSYISDHSEGSDSESSIFSVDMPRAVPTNLPHTDVCTYLGIRDTAAHEVIGHDFGLGKHYYNNRKAMMAIMNRLGTVFADRPGFAPPLLGIDSITFAYETIYFQRDNLHYVYNWRLTPGVAMLENFSISISPIQHESIITYYQIHWPFTFDTVSYRDNFVYGCNSSTHHIITSFKYGALPSSIIAWMYFQLDDLVIDSIRISIRAGSVYVHHGQTLYEYLHMVKGLRPIMANRPHIFLLDSYNKRDIYPFCLRPDGALVDYIAPSGVCIYCDSHPWLKHTVNIRGMGSVSTVIVDVDSPQTHAVSGSVLIINAHNRSYFKTTTLKGILVSDGAQLVIYSPTKYGLSLTHFRLIEKIPTTKTVFYLYVWLDTPRPLDCIYSNKDWFVFESGHRFYSSLIDHKVPQPITEIILTSSSGCTVQHNLIERKSTKGSSMTDVFIETCADRFERLCSLAEMFGRTTRLSIFYTRRAAGVSYGGGIRRVFTQDALSVFASQYLILYGSVCEFNLEAMRDMPVLKLFNMGRALHTAIYLTRTCLSVRLPVSILAALLKRELTIKELEYFVKKESPEIYESVCKYRDDQEGISMCGYASYESCLKQLIYYDSGTAETNARSLFISKVLADGIVSYAPIPNIESMNALTLDYYLSGEYSIDRIALAKLIKGSELVMGFIKGLITTLPEHKLAALLRNWTGSSVTKDAALRITEESKGSIKFRTCSRALIIDPRLITDSSIIPRADLIDLLTTPITAVND